jgi:N6-adenosine-specific RNA methylase IME4
MSGVDPSLRRAVDAIVVGERHRRDMGDLAALARSIEEVGLLHPIVIRPDGALIAGARRLAAAHMLGLTEVPVTVVDLGAVVKGEHAENSFRKDFTLSEAVAVKRALEPIERAAAQERMRAGRPMENFSKGRALDAVATATGLHRTTLGKAEAVVDAAEAEPERFGKLLEDMDRCGRANGPYRRLQNIKAAEAIRNEPPPLPRRGPYRVIAADPPWPFELRDEDPSRRAIYPYPTMTLAKIKTLRVADIAHEDSVLWLWTTNFHMREAFDVLEAWGFEHKTILTWVKDRFGYGEWLRCQTEHVLLATRGRPIVQLGSESTVLFAPVRAHSEKPDAFYDLVERLCPAPRYCELFSRRARPNWDGHSAEAPAAESDAESPPRLKRAAG